MRIESQGLSLTRREVRVNIFISNLFAALRHFAANGCYPLNLVGMHLEMTDAYRKILSRVVMPPR